MQEQEQEKEQAQDQVHTARAGAGKGAGAGSGAPCRSCDLRPKFRKIRYVGADGGLCPDGSNSVATIQ